MTVDFDVYHKWLGIPRHEQPANYYRLLGLAIYESDPEVIQHAADRQCDYVRGLRDDPHGDLAPPLLEELTEAVDCLLEPARKRLYDEGLRAGRHIERRNPEVAPPISPSSNPVTGNILRTATEPPITVPHDQTVTISKAASKSEQSAARAKVGGYPWMSLGASGFVVVLALVAVVAWNGGDNQTDTDADQNKPQEVTADSAEAGSASLDPPAPAVVGNSESHATSDITTPEAIASAATSTPTPVVESDLAAQPQRELPAAVASQDSSDTTQEAAARRVEAATAESNASAVDVTSTARGMILREMWRSVPGNKVDEFEKYVAEHPQPSEVTALDRFQSPEDEADNYGQRVSGFLFPPTTGEYTFTIRANAEGVLYLTDAEHADQRRLILEDEKVQLEANRAYRVEAFHKESTGKDNFAISWTLPDGTVESPIPGERLSIAYHIPAAHERGFVPLEIVSATASAGSTLQVLDDGRILASGKEVTGEEYRITLRTNMDRLTGLLLETLPHDSLPAAGPGRVIAGRFALGEISASLISASNADAATALPFRAAADASSGNEVRLIDGKPETVWRGNGHGEPASIVLVLAEPLQLTAETQVTLTIANRESLGCFRLLGTSAPHPLKVKAAKADAGRTASGMFVLHANLGGEDYTAPDGIVWRKTALFDNLTFGYEGGQGVVEQNVQNPVQGSAVRGIMAFRAIVPNGTYDVTLFFAEYWSTTSGSRRFSIAAEQRPVAVNFDLLQTAGFAHPFVMPLRNIVVRDDRLDIDFQAATPGSSTLLNAIRIQQVK